MGCKDVEIRKSYFVTKTQFLSFKRNEMKEYKWNLSAEFYFQTAILIFIGA